MLKIQERAQLQVYMVSKWLYPFKKKFTRTFIILDELENLLKLEFIFNLNKITNLNLSHVG